MKKIKQIIFASDSKVSPEAYQLIEDLFGIKAVLVTNESKLEDFIEIEENASLEKAHSDLFEQIGELYGVVIPEVLRGETRVWKVAALLIEKFTKITSQKQIIRKLPS